MRSHESGDESSWLMREILAYLIHHPDAKDTVEGIHKFWLSDIAAQVSLSRLGQALEFLTERQGWLIRKTVGSQVTLYGINKDRVDEIRSFLGDS